MNIFNKILRKQFLKSEINKDKVILHITNTDINKDARISKEIDTLSKVKYYKIFAIGLTNIKSEEKAAYRKSSAKRYKIISLELFSEKLKFLPRILFIILYVLELTIKFFIKGLSLRPNVIHCHDTPALVPALLIKLFINTKIIYDAHELEAYRAGQNKFSSFLILNFEKLFWRQIDYLITVSDSIRIWYQESIGPKDSCVILNSPYHTLLNSKRNNYLRNYFELPTEAKIFIYIGALVPGRAINLLIDVFKITDLNNHIIFIGYGPLDEVIKKASKSTNNIHLHESIVHEDLLSISNSADFGFCLIEPISISDYYSIPNKLLEYSFARLKIIGSDFPEISKIINKYQLGKTCKVELDSIVDVVNNACLITYDNNVDLYKISWEYQAVKLIDLYQIQFS